MAEAWQRRPDFERDFLEHITRAAGLAGPAGDYLADQVRARLEKGAREYGAEGYLERPLHELLAELTEEPMDVAGWSILIALRTYRDLPTDAGGDIRQELVEIAAAGARLWARAEGLRQRLQR